VSRVAAENSIAEYVFPLISSSAKDPEIEEPVWTDRFLTTMKFLNERGYRHSYQLFWT
jgi:hypothetical protein